MGQDDARQERTREQERAVYRYVNAHVKEAAKGRRVQEMVSVMQDFYDAFSADRIDAILTEWNLADRIRRSADAPVFLTKDGVRWNHEMPSGIRREQD